MNIMHEDLARAQMTARLGEAQQLPPWPPAGHGSPAQPQGRAGRAAGASRPRSRHLSAAIEPHRGSTPDRRTNHDHADPPEPEHRDESHARKPGPRTNVRAPGRGAAAAARPPAGSCPSPQPQGRAGRAAGASRPRSRPLRPHPDRPDRGDQREPGTTTTRRTRLSPFRSGGHGATLGCVKTCDFCGRRRPTRRRRPHLDHRGRERPQAQPTATTCSREHLRAMEGKLDSEWW